MWKGIGSVASRISKSVNKVFRRQEEEPENEKSDFVLKIGEKRAEYGFTNVIITQKPKKTLTDSQTSNPAQDPNIKIDHK